MNSNPDPASGFIDAAVWHGPLDEARAILTAHPEIAGRNIFVASILGDDVAVRRFLAKDPASSTTKGGPRGWDPLTYLCFSKYLRLDSARSDAFVSAATALLDAGADARTGFFDPSHQPEPGFESALYAAAGVAHHAGLTQLLLERGADPNDGEVAYHSPEGDNNDAFKVLVGTGRLTADSLTIMLVRKADWHDLEGIQLLLNCGADPNRGSRWGFSGLHQAVRRDNALEIIEAMLFHGGDPNLPNKADGRSASAIAARRGRGDLLALFERHGFPPTLDGVDRLISGCARDDTPSLRAIRLENSDLMQELQQQGGTLLSEFAGNGNTAGIRHLLDLGVPVDARYVSGDGYFGIAEQSTALHVAAWKLRSDVLKLLIDRGAAVNVSDGKGNSPIALAVKGCVDSFWTERRSAEAVSALLSAGASVTGVRFPSGYAPVDELLRAHGAAP